MRLLLTRATEDSARTRSKLEAAGHEVLVSPVIEMRGTGARWPEGIVDAVLATSAQAFIRLASGPAPEARRLMPLFLVGERTEQAALTADFRGAAVVARSAAALTTTMSASAMTEGRMVYLAGVDRKQDLEDGLHARGCRPIVVEVYEALAAATLDGEAIASLAEGSLDGVLHFSRRSAALFSDLAAMAGLGVPTNKHFCLSEDTAVPLRTAGYPDVHIAGAPTEAALLALVGA